MSNKSNAETDLEKIILVGFGRLPNSYATFYEAYKQGFLDGRKSIDKINEAYKLDIKAKRQ